MPYDLSWQVEGRVMLARFSGDLTYDDLAQYLQESIALAKTGEPPVHTIATVAQITEFPRDVVKISRLMINVGPAHGWVVYVGVSPAQRPIVLVAARLTFTSIHLAASVNSAMIFLRYKDPTLAG